MCTSALEREKRKLQFVTHCVLVLIFRKAGRGEALPKEDAFPTPGGSLTVKKINGEKGRHRALNGRTKKQRKEGSPLNEHNDSWEITKVAALSD